MLRLRRGIVAVVAAAGLTAALAGSTGASASAHGGGGGNAKPAAAGYTVAGGLDGVGVVSNSNAWAVGTAGPKILMLHWNGKAWSRVTRPSVLTAAGGLSAVKVVSAKDAWAVGDTVGAGSTTRSLLLHWNGKTWSQVTSPAPVKNGVLSAVTATTSGGWAVGYISGSAAVDYRTLIFRLSGAKWSLVSTKLGGGAGLTGVATTAAKTTWAIGDEVGMISGVLAKWNGSTWAWDPSFPVAGQYHALDAIAASSKGIAFAVGANGNVPETPALSMEWTGKAWKKVAVAAPDLSSLDAVTFAPGGAAWAAGQLASGHTLIMRWTGKEWARVASPGPAADLAALGFSTATYGWAVGRAETTSGTSKTLILHWNGHAWS